LLKKYIDKRARQPVFHRRRDDRGWDLFLFVDRWFLNPTIHDEGACVQYDRFPDRLFPGAVHPVAGLSRSAATILGA